MKRALFILAVCILLLNLCACDAASDSSSETVSYPEVNFNNNYWFSGDFWAFEDTLFYLQDGFYNMGTYHNTGRHRNLLFQESDFLNDSTIHAVIGDIFVWDHYLYFDLNTEHTDILYRYDLNEGRYAPVCEVPNMYRWVVADAYFIYTEHPANSQDKSTPLHIYNMTDGTTTEVCGNVEEFGIVEGQLRYITCTDVYKLYQYDYAENRSTLLGTFSCEFDAKYDIFNFTPDGVVMLNWGREYERNLVVYTLSSDTTAVYTLPKGIQHMVAYDQYAYAVVYDTRKNSSESLFSPENGIYRINLSDGSYEVIERNAGDDTEIHVVSDDCIYIVQRKMNFLFQSRRHVYQFDYTTGQKEKLAVI